MGQNLRKYLQTSALPLGYRAEPQERRKLQQKNSTRKRRIGGRFSLQGWRSSPRRPAIDVITATACRQAAALHEKTIPALKPDKRIPRASAESEGGSPCRAGARRHAV